MSRGDQQSWWASGSESNVHQIHRLRDGWCSLLSRFTDSRCTAPMWFKKGYIIPNVRPESGFPCVLDNLTSEHAAAVGWLRRAITPSQLCTTAVPHMNCSVA